MTSRPPNWQTTLHVTFLRLYLGQINSDEGQTFGINNSLTQQTLLTYLTHINNHTYLTNLTHLTNLTPLTYPTHLKFLTGST